MGMNRRHASVMGTVLALTGFWTASAAALPRADFDLDNDGLIEINDLYDLDEVQNNPSWAGAERPLVPAARRPAAAMASSSPWISTSDENGDGVVGRRRRAAFSKPTTATSGWISIQTPLAASFEGNNHRHPQPDVPRPVVELSGLFLYLVGATVRNLRFANVDLLDAGYGHGDSGGEPDHVRKLRAERVRRERQPVRQRRKQHRRLGRERCAGRTIQERAESGDGFPREGQARRLDLAPWTTAPSLAAFVRGRTASPRYYGFTRRLGWLHDCRLESATANGESGNVGRRVLVRRG